MLNHHVDISLEDQVAVTKVEQTFRNHTDRRLEATYVFPVPEGASVREFAMWVNGKRVKGELLKANKAKQKNTSIRNFRGVRGGWRDMISRVPVKYANLLEKDGSRRRLGGLEFVNDGDVLRYKDPKQLCVGGVPGNPNGQAYIESWHKTLRARLRVQFDVERPGAYMDPDQRYLRTDQSRGRAQHDTGADLNTGTSRGRKNTRSSVQAKPTGLVGEAERNQIQAALDPRGQGLHFMERDIANAKGADAVDDHESGKQVWMAGD